ncbi:inactive rhomboid protein 1-like [Dysidea avara]|uniref:inactive rhomboid protein 1-like n=1 Tax=Dysidea avara TaxID=196820 RepID=UPI00331CF8D5
MADLRQQGVCEDDFYQQYWKAIRKGDLRDSLRLTGKGTIRLVKWVFGFEPEDDVDHKWWKWEARQRTLRILRTTTNEQPARRSNTEDSDQDNTVENEGYNEDTDFIDGSAATTDVQEIGISTRTGRDPDNSVIVPEDPKPHLWTMAWKGIKWITNKFWEGEELITAHIPGRHKRPFVEYEGDDDDDSDDSEGRKDESIKSKLSKYDFFGKDVSYLQNVWQGDHMDNDEVDGPLDFLIPPSYIKRQRQIKVKEDEIKKIKQNRQGHHLGFTGTLLRFKYKDNGVDCTDNKKGLKIKRDPDQLKVFDKFYQLRPLFTMWIMFTHILVMIVTASIYGLAPYGFDFQTETDLIQRSNFGLELVQRTISTSVWGGLSQEDLILLGARYAPCMRRDRELFDLIEEDRIAESQSGCCIRNDGSGCIQVNTQLECNSIFLRFLQNDTAANPSGVVCGQSPRTCTSPKSVEPHVWNNDITRWPRCRNSNTPTPSPQDAHLSCEIIGRPCCIGILAKCVIASLEYCNYMKGRYHEEAFLCSQVDCLQDTCGLISFVNEHEPDQFYRVWISLFLHGGWIHLLCTCTFNFLLMRDVEKQIGWFPLGTVYLGSGFAGNILSAIVIPYRPEVGPAGSIMGVMAAVLVYVVWEWKKFLYPKLELSKVLLIIVFFFCLGMFPYVDNFAHLGGLIGGLLLSAMVVPFYSLFNGDLRSGHKQVDKLKLILIIICAPLFAIFYGALFIIFYEAQPNCYICQYLTCIPFSDTICQDQRPTPDHRDIDIIIRPV